MERTNTETPRGARAAGTSITIERVRDGISEAKVEEARRVVRGCHTEREAWMKLSLYESFKARNGRRYELTHSLGQNCILRDPSTRGEVTA